MPHALNKFALVIPTLNEADNILTVLHRTTTALSRLPIDWEMLVVDDSSADGTADIARQYSQTDARVRVFARHNQHGLAGAITYGWAQSNADLLGVMDADLQHPPETLLALVEEACNGFDLVIASRYVQPHSMDGWNPLRRLISRISVFASQLAQRPSLRVNDPLSGFFVVQRKCIAGLTFQSSGFKLLLEVLARGQVESVREIPFKFAVRERGKSKAGAMTAVHYIRLLCRLTCEEIVRAHHTR